MTVQFLPVAEICILHASDLIFRLVGTVPLLFLFFCHHVRHVSSSKLMGDTKGEHGIKNEIVKRAHKFACFISFFLLQVSASCCNRFRVIHHIQGLHDSLPPLSKRRSSRDVPAQDTWPGEEEGRVRLSIHHEAQNFQIPILYFAFTTFLYLNTFFFLNQSEKKKYNQF